MNFLLAILANQRYDLTMQIAIAVILLMGLVLLSGVVYVWVVANTKGVKGDREE